MNGRLVDECRGGPVIFPLSRRELLSHLDRGEIKVSNSPKQTRRNIHTFLFVLKIHAKYTQENKNLFISSLLSRAIPA